MKKCKHAAGWKAKLVSLALLVGALGATPARSAKPDEQQSQSQSGD